MDQIIRRKKALEIGEYFGFVQGDEHEQTNVQFQNYVHFIYNIYIS